MGWLDGEDYFVQAKNTDSLTMTADSISVNKEIFVSGPPIDDLADFESGNILLLVASQAGVPKLGDGYTQQDGSPVCTSVDVKQVEDSDHKAYSLYEITCTYETGLGRNDVGLLEFDPAENPPLGAYKIGFGERVYFEFEESTANLQEVRLQTIPPYSSDENDIVGHYGNGSESRTVGETEDGSIDGVDVAEYNLVLTVEHYRWSQDIDWKFQQIALGTTNSTANFYGFDYRTCLCIGVEEVSRTAILKKSGGDDALVKMRYRFAVGQDLSSGDLPEFTDKDGAPINISNGKPAWDYLWQKIGRQGDTDNTKTYTEKVQVHEVYEQVNFTDPTVFGISGVL